jgi:predicted lactoylglutathione lyase
MIKDIYVNLPVRDLAASKKFFESIGFVFDPKFTDEKAACLVLGEGKYVMLLSEEFFKSFTTKNVTDTSRSIEAMIACSVDNKDDVDTIVDKALAAGSTEPNEPQEEHGIMYGRSFEDLDGHMWEIVWMNVG